MPHAIDHDAIIYRFSATGSDGAHTTIAGLDANGRHIRWSICKTDLLKSAPS